MNLQQVEQLVFDSLAETLANLGCAGPPVCKQPGCPSKGEHDTFLAMSNGVMELQIDDQEYELRVEKKHKGV